ncbi:MAG: hypothetical protein ABI282_07330 [Candidatus Baltobacteraceae bacterium]
MITVRDDESREERARLAWALFASFILNIAIWTVSAWLFGAHVDMSRPNQREQYLVASTSVRIEHRTVPQPQRAPSRSVAVPSHPRATHVTMRQPPAHREEISRTNPNATPVPRAAQKPATLAQTLAAQEQEFARESQSIHANNNPLSIATIAPQPPATYRRSYMDLSGEDQQEHVSAVLRVLSKFVTATMHCYYVHYDAQFSGGGTDDGNIPWPVCYPKDNDAMLPLDRVHVLPIPKPQADYVLPPGVVLSPLLRDIYTGKIHA